MEWSQRLLLLFQLVHFGDQPIGPPWASDAKIEVPIGTLWSIYDDICISPVGLDNLSTNYPFVYPPSNFFGAPKL